MENLNSKDLSRPIAVTIGKAQELTGLGRTSLYNLMQQRKLHKIKVGARTLIGYDELEHLVTPHKKQVNDLSNEGNA